MDIKKFLAAKWWYEKGFTELTDVIDIKKNSEFDSDFYDKIHKIQTNLKEELVSVFGKELTDRYFTLPEHKNKNMHDDEELAAIKEYAELYQRKLQADFDFWAVTQLYQVIENADRLRYLELKQLFAESNNDGEWTTKLDPIL